MSMRRTPLWIGLALLSGCTDLTVVSEGDRVGTVTKLSRKLRSCSAR